MREESTQGLFKNILDHLELKLSSLNSLKNSEVMESIAGLGRRKEYEYFFNPRKQVTMKKV